MTTEQRYFGLLRDAPSELIELLDDQTLRALVEQGWAPESTLFYSEVRDAFDANIGVLATLHAWDEESPLVWVVTTVGMGSIVQPLEGTGAEEETFPRIELATVSNTISPKGPIPQSLAVALSDVELPDWDWAQVEVPPLMEWLLLTAQNLASMTVHDGAVFRLGQYVVGTGNPTPASRLLDVLLMPACPQMLAAGLEPMRDGQPTPVEDWWSEPGHDACDLGFVWALPIDEDERRVVETDGVGELFAQLTERADAEGRADELDVAFDFLRLPFGD